MSVTEQKSIAVLISGAGRGSNLAALMAACVSGEIAGRIVVVIGTRADAPALERARLAGIATSVVSPVKYAGNEAGYAQTLLRILHKHQIDLICLAGYMRQLPTTVVAEFPHQILNIHPSLLPAFGGQGMYGENVHRAVIESGATESGCTVHWVDNGYDTGEIVLQRRVPVLPNDTPQTLGARVLVQEHLAYIEAVKLVCGI